LDALRDPARASKNNWQRGSCGPRHSFSRSVPKHRAAGLEFSRDASSGSLSTVMISSHERLLLDLVTIASIEIEPCIRNVMLCRPRQSASARQPGRLSFGSIWRCWLGLLHPSREPSGGHRRHYRSPGRAVDAADRPERDHVFPRGTNIRRDGPVQCRKRLGGLFALLPSGGSVNGGRCLR
jgi:hypothetical protein